jgi:hypothetical protein
MNYIELMEKQNKLLKELQECNTKGDKIVITNKLRKVQEQLKDLEETTVSGDIAVAPSPMNKDKIMKRPKLDEIEESVSFTNFFDIDKNSSEFKR